MTSNLLKQIRALSLFTFLDKSSEESIKMNKRLSITTENWNDRRQEFLEERYFQRKHEAWNLAEWAKHELLFLNSLDFEEPDRQVLKERYSNELSKIIKGRFKVHKQEYCFKWIAGENKLKLLFDKLKAGRYIQCTCKKFEQLFNGQEASRIKAIEWQATQWELGYFIELLLKNELIAKCKHIRTACLLFIGNNGQQLKESSLKNQMSEARRGVAGNEAKQARLDALIDSLAAE